MTVILSVLAGLVVGIIVTAVAALVWLLRGMTA